MLALVASIAFLYYQDRQQAACMERYNEATSAVSRARADATNQDWAALDELVRQARGGSFAPGADQYLGTRDRTLKLREESPLVAPPSNYCS